MTASLDAEALGQATTGRRFIGQGGAPVEYHARIGSTNDRVATLSAEGAPEGALVVAGCQEKGRGRMERTWVSPEGGLYLSLLLRPDEAMMRRLPATLLGGLAVAEALEATAKVQAELKWPNDVQLEGRKVAGILGELTRDSSGSRLVLGVGINVSVPADAFPPEVAEVATSLAQVTDAPPPLLEVLTAFLERFEAHYEEVQRGGGASILSAASNRMPILGKQVRVKLVDRTLEGKANGLNATGGLVLEMKDGTSSVVLAGEVEEVRAK